MFVPALPQTAQVVAGTVKNNSGSTVYYRDEPFASTNGSDADGSITVGSSAVLSGSQWLATAKGTAGSSVTFAAAQPETAQSGSGVNYVATDADLPETATGHPVILVLEDSAALDGDGNPQASLRYWTGSSWSLLGLAGGGTVSSDFIEIPANLAGLSDGQFLLWSDSLELFRPGALS